MEEDLILITQLNDFMFCPISIYFHNLYLDRENLTYQKTDQTKGIAAHKAIDEKTYSTKRDVISGMDVYSAEYGLIGKIDILDIKRKLLVERKKKVNAIYDGFIFQLYGQYYSLKEMGYEVNELRIHSIDDNKNYHIDLPEQSPEMVASFQNLIIKMRNLDIDSFKQNNEEKCRHCIYESACDRSLIG